MATFAKAQQSARGQGETPRLTTDEAREIAVDAYLYAYPLVLMELTRRTMTNVGAPTPTGKAPMNQFSHARAFPDPGFTDVVRPNADTLYSMLWYDVSKEPLVVSVPDSGRRYYLLPMLDLWTDVFASPGARTTGTGAQAFTVVGPVWQGDPPAGTRVLRSPTSVGWIVGRTQTNGTADYANVHDFQNHVTAVPLGQLGKAYVAPAASVNPEWDTKTPPVAQIDRLSPEAFFSLFARLMRLNPPHGNDYPMLHRMQQIGLEPGKAFSFGEAPHEIRRALEDAGAVARKRIVDIGPKSGVLANGWRIPLTAAGTYGADYLHRAGVAYYGLGANTIEDAVYPTAFTDADGQPMSSERAYVLHFDAKHLPPARAFWSLTMYDDRQRFTENSMDRYAIGDRDPLQLNPDGSLDLFIQRESPGEERESNWLPAPESGPFTMNLRLYWPKAEVVDGTWAPPPVQHVG